MLHRSGGERKGEPGGKLNKTSRVSCVQQPVTASSAAEERTAGGKLNKTSSQPHTITCHDIMCTYILIMKIQKETKPIFPSPNFQLPTVLTKRLHFKELLILNNTFFQSLSEHSMKHSKQQEVQVSFTVHIPTEGQQQGKKPPH